MKENNKICIEANTDIPRKLQAILTDLIYSKGVNLQ
jgi:hypothetical protein